LLNNQKKTISDVGSVSSMSKGSVKQTDSVNTKSVKSFRKADKKGTTTTSLAGATGGMSFSKAGKSIAHKML